jgi:hypothetical protein
MKMLTDNPYSLCGDQENSDQYYNDLDAFGEKAIIKLSEYLGRVTEEFMRHNALTSLNMPASREEYLFEALLIGSFWNIYGGYASATHDSTLDIMKQLAGLRQVKGITGITADKTRGLLGIKLMKIPEHRDDFLIPGVNGFVKLIQWMEATGEFQREALRFREWLAFFKYQDETYTFISICLMKNAAKRFSVESESVMGTYTGGVNSFNRQFFDKYQLREDAISVLRDRSEYHLGMLGAYIINRSTRNEFLKTKEKVLLVPGCLKSSQLSGCKSIKDKKGEICAGCNAGCMINQLRQLGNKHNFDLRILSHSSDLSAWAARPGEEQQVGVIGVACLTTLLSGGFELKKHGIAAQCIALDHSGCRHWKDNPENTGLNINELLRRINADKTPSGFVNENKKSRTGDPVAA